jgi:hypothetical protein
MVQKSVLLVVCLPICIGIMWAQAAPADSAPPQANTPPAATAKNPWMVGPFTFSALVDGYYSYNFNDPGSETNLLRNFDVRANQPSVSMAKFRLDHDADPVGFHLEAGLGRAFDIIESFSPGGALDGWKQIREAYVSVKPKQWKGLQVDFGKFYTSAEAEVTDTIANWNYSRSLLYAFGPYYHTGLRTTMPVTKTISGGFQLVEGWNGYDGKNHGVTAGFTGTYTPNTKWNWATAYYVGPEDVLGIKTFRHYVSTTLAINPVSKVNYYLSFDYGADRLPRAQPVQSYYGVATAARYQFAKKLAVAPRIEWYRDADGWITGTKQAVKEFTLTGEWKHSDYFLTRVEFRRDWSDQPFFPSGDLNAPVGNQSTILIGMVAYIGPKR